MEPKKTVKEWDGDVTRTDWVEEVLDREELDHLQVLFDFLDRWKFDFYHENYRTLWKIHCLLNDQNS